MGMRGTASEGYRVFDLFVPEAYSGTREDPSLRRDTGPLYAFTMQGLYAVGVAGVAFGIARAMLDAFISLATRRPRAACSAWPTARSYRPMSPVGRRTSVPPVPG